MGGNLLKIWHLPEKRLTTAEYEKVKSDFIADFKSHVRQHVTYSPYDSERLFCGVETAQFVRSKETHGDIDIIIGLESGVTIDSFSWRIGDKSGNDLPSYLHARYGYKPHSNGGVHSIPIDGFQADVTVVPNDVFKTHLAYSAWGDLGNIMGRIYHKLGIHYGHDGLSFWIRQGMFDKNIAWSDNDHIYEKKVISRNMRVIFELGGFDYTRWCKGFDTEEDVFKFVASSKYFNREIFKLESLNHSNRTRNRKRGMYMRFIEWCEQAKPENKIEEYLDKGIFSLIIQLQFPELVKTIGEYRLKYEVTKAVTDKVNGSKVAEWFNCEGVEVGSYMKRLKTLPQQQLLQMSESEIKQYLKSKP